MAAAQDTVYKALTARSEQLRQFISDRTGAELDGSCFTSAIYSTLRASCLTPLLVCPQVIAQIWVLLLGGLGVAYGLDVWVRLLPAAG
jgi:hypothetical protein